MDIRTQLRNKSWFTNPGTYVLFDGQYGSTGKGLLAAVLADRSPRVFDLITTNAGPNSGHTAFIMGKKVVTRQLPVASVHHAMAGHPHICYLNAGAVIDPTILCDEVAEYFDYYTDSKSRIVIHPNAAVIKSSHIGDGPGTGAHIASTGKGVGPAMADKINRLPEAVIGHVSHAGLHKTLHNLGVEIDALAPRHHHGVTFVEVAQGWSLGLNSRFYPYVTSRDCSPAMAMADAGLPVQSYQKSIVSLRTFPIRVGNTGKGTSGGCYPDQKETTFQAIGVPDEITTVTKRPRRVFTWSNMQFGDMLLANRPEALFFNFCNYLPDTWESFVQEKVSLYCSTIGYPPDFVLTGHGPNIEDVHLFDFVMIRPF